jgi:cobalt-zinc-cadmium efflux system membrane fusion protein
VARIAGIETTAARGGEAGAEVVAPATIAYDATRLARVNARAPGVVRAIRAEMGERVRPGSPLATIESAALGSDRSRLQAVRSRLTAAEAAYRREKDLFEKGISAQKDLLAAEQEWEAARAESASAQAALGMVGGGAGGGGVYTLAAPIAGIVTERNATIGFLVASEDVLFEIADVSTMWAEIAVREDQLSDVATGQRVIITVDGISDREFSGTIAVISSKLDPRTRTATARVALQNPEGLLRANMFGRARIQTGGRGMSVLVPREAVQRSREDHVVFVPIRDGVYQARTVRVLGGDGGLVTIEGAIRAGDFVVTKGSFLLKTETLKESIGAGCCEVEPPRSGG